LPALLVAQRKKLKLWQNKKIIVKQTCFLFFCGKTAVLKLIADDPRTIESLSENNEPSIHKYAKWRRRLLMSENYVELQDIPVMRVKADMKGKGPAAAFDILESKLPTLKGRKFYGCFHETPEGEEYYACVARVEGDNPDSMQLDIGIIPGGKYARRKISDWESKVREGQLPRLFQEMIETYDVDLNRPSIEFYRSQTELQLLLPVH